MLYLEVTIDWLHMRDKGTSFPSGMFPEKGVMPMDIAETLSLMIAFGTLIAFIMSNQSKK